MTNLYLHASVASSIETLSNDPPHALLLNGKRGVGLYTIATSTAGAKAIVVQPELLTKTSSIKQIGIDQVRELYEMTRAKSSKKQFVIIDDADAMTVPAQNAFLKLLEEPAESVHFILTSHTPDQLLPTIRSRVRSQYIPPLSLEETKQLITSSSSKKQQQIMFIARGLPAEIHRLERSDEYFTQMVDLTTSAKTLLEATAYEAVRLVAKLSPDRDKSLRLIEQAIFLLSFQPTSASSARTQQFFDVHAAIKRGGNVKIQFLSAVL